MKKHVMLTALMGMTLCAGTSFASPATNYAPGAVTIEAGINAAPSMKVGDADGDDKSRPYAGVTVGLGSNFALQYKYSDNKVNDLDGSGFHAGMKTQEYNIAYQAGPNTYVYAGDMSCKGTGVLSSSSDDRFQVGVRYVAPAGDKTNWWVGGAVGDSLWRAEIGASYAVAPNVDWDLSYQYTQVNDYHDAVDVKTQGLYTGLTFKL